MTSGYIAFALASLAVIAILVIVRWRRGGADRLTPLAGLAFGCILAGIFFGENRAVGYTLFAAGIILAVIDIVRRWQGSGPSRPKAG